LANGESELLSPLLCDDTLATSEALSMIGASTSWSAEAARVIGAGRLVKPKAAIFCKESATTLRIMTAVCATMPHETQLTAGTSLLRRPVEDLTSALKTLGAACESDHGYPPVRVRGPLKGGTTEIPGNISSQYVSALLLAAPLARGPLKIRIRGTLESKPYVEVTLDMQRRFGIAVDVADSPTSFGITPQEYESSSVQIEGDWSSAAILLVGAALSGEKVTLRRLSGNSLQADKRVTSILEKMNADVRLESDSVTVSRSDLMPADTDVADCPDLFPAVCGLCATAHGTSSITGIRRLRLKESNRVEAMRAGLGQMGVRTREAENWLAVYGGKVHAATIDPQRDHRVAMAFAMLGMVTEGVKILDADCVTKSYPSFWQDIEGLGAQVMST
jgi:3-phosphoshikimate 1-carboxyvinyltransferase